MTRILVVGSANIDYALAVPRLPRPGETIDAYSFDQNVGGKGVNQAVAAARAGGSVDMVARIGTGDLGQVLRDALVAEGIGVDHVVAAEMHSGMAFVLTAIGGDNMIAVVPGANAQLEPSALTADQFAGKRVVLCQLEIPMMTVLRAAEMARAAAATFILDPAPAKALPCEMWTHVDWVTPNETEAGFLLDQPSGEIDPVVAAVQIRAMGVGNVIMKLGARGALLLCKDGDPIVIRPHLVTPIDTTAAGDSFNGAFAVALSEGASSVDAAQFASAASALTVTRAGACAAMPNRAEIERLVLKISHAAAAVR